MKNICSMKANTEKIILSSNSRVYKTEKFFFATKKVENIDKYALKIAEYLQNEIEKIKKSLNSKNDYIKITAKSSKISLMAKLGFQIDNKDNLENDDIIFFDCENISIGHTETRIKEELFEPNFEVLISVINNEVVNEKFMKLYLLSGIEYVNFPLLNNEQQSLVSIENKNVIVQGVAGSGKTNICTNKIIFCACKDYNGKILYTTFSRSLLIDTKQKIDIFKNNLIDFLTNFEKGNIEFLDNNHKKSIENRLGITLTTNNDDSIINQLKQIVIFLESNVEYLLLEDIFEKYFPNETVNFSNQETFEKEFLTNLNNHQLKSKLIKLSSLSSSVIYKEIYGIIQAKCENSNESITLENYIELRKNSFNKQECELIFELNKEYQSFKEKNNYIDNNDISKRLLNYQGKLKKYTLSIIDEVQDFTQINLLLLKSLSIKMFCVGDALQMINPSYFSFAFLKRLMYNQDITNVAQLQANYRNNKKIVELLEEISKLNTTTFGVHNFVVAIQNVDDNNLSNTIFINEKDFEKKLDNQKLNNFTIIVNDEQQKKQLREKLPKQEILTVAEAKGLERETVVLYNVLSQNKQKWDLIQRLNISHKLADENSVYRYYFNLFYVALSRAKHNLFVFENQKIDCFKNFFEQNFSTLSAKEGINKLASIVGKIEYDEFEIVSRIDEFIKLGQFENAKFYADKLEESEFRQGQNDKIEIYKNYVFKNQNEMAGIKFLQSGLMIEAKKQFTIQNNKNIIKFIEFMEANNIKKLDLSILKYFNKLGQIEESGKIVNYLLNEDIQYQKNLIKNNKEKIKNFKGRK